MQREYQLIPELIVRNGPAALEFYKAVFGFEEIHRMMTSDGQKLVHGELILEGHKLFVCDEFPASEGGTCQSPETLGGTGVRVTLILADADGTVARATAAGARVSMPVQDMFWGGRYGKIVDPFGHEWGINQQLKEQTIDETEAAADEYFAKRRRESDPRFADIIIAIGSAARVSPEERSTAQTRPNGSVRRSGPPSVPGG